MSEALIVASTNPQYDDRSFIKLQVQYRKIPSSNQGRTCYVQILYLTFRTMFVHNMFSPCSAKRRASNKDLPVNHIIIRLTKIMNSLAKDIKILIFKFIESFQIFLLLRILIRRLLRYINKIFENLL